MTRENMGLDYMNTNHEWLIEMAERENGCCVSVGGLYVKLARMGIESLPPEEQSEEPKPVTPDAAHTS